jgi:hypothetical protein
LLLVALDSTESAADPLAVAELVLATVVFDFVEAGGPLLSGGERGEAERFDKIAREHRVGGGRILEIGGETTTGEGAGGDEALVAIGSDSEG